MKILGISGSLRAESFNTKLLKVAAGLAPDGTEIEIVGLDGVPVYREEDFQRGFPAAVESLRERIRAADAVLIATPEYNYSIPGPLKNAIDWISRPPDQPFDDKPIALMGASAGKFGTTRAQHHLRQVFVFLNGRVMNKPEVLIGAAGSAFDENGALVDDVARDLVAQLVSNLGDWAQRLG